MKRGRTRSKPCSSCNEEARALFRARIEGGGDWRFFCERCLLAVRANNPDYVYGGTWKARKRH